ncbi:hypothetical protein BDN72DRAFT_896307 [Pluteus cervinus]|uniref:Uncharacterized protein n=1 Tax=Pluteus cervinus TaxID=181527 RepID=A0ACD3AYD5_9AGAR|nr:hypothetical protein BDN72DRAFT_896307 [Pluteus cervinus]
MAPSSQLPPEVLSVIFKYAITSTYLLDYSPLAGIYGGYYSDLRFRKGLLHVCRVWHEAAIQVLYEDVVFRRCIQIPMFLGTLERVPYLRGVVKSIMILCHPLPDCEEKFTGDIQKLYESCAKATHIEYLPPFYEANRLEGSRTKDFIPPISQNITHFTFGTCVPYAIVAICLEQVQGTIRSLSITMGEDSDPAPATQKLSFPHLNILEIISFDYRPDQWNHLLSWEAYSITHLAFSSPRGWRPEVLEGILELMKNRHLGQALKFLHIRTESNIQRHLDVCPRLEHLVVPQNQVFNKLTHPKIRWLDLWPTGLNLDIDDLSEFLDTDHLPRLRGVRTFHVSLYPFLQLPLLYPPDLHVEGGPQSGLEEDGIQLPLEICACWTKLERFGWTFLHPLKDIVKHPHQVLDELCGKWCNQVEDQMPVASELEPQTPETSTDKSEGLGDDEDSEDLDWIPSEEDSDGDLTSEGSDSDVGDDMGDIPLEERESIDRKWVRSYPSMSIRHSTLDVVIRTYRHRLQ